MSDVHTEYHDRVLGQYNPLHYKRRLKDIGNTLEMIDAITDKQNTTRQSDRKQSEDQHLALDMEGCALGKPTDIIDALEKRLALVRGEVHRGNQQHEDLIHTLAQCSAAGKKARDLADDIFLDFGLQDVVLWNTEAELSTLKRTMEGQRDAGGERADNAWAGMSITQQVCDDAIRRAEAADYRANIAEEAACRSDSEVAVAVQRANEAIAARDDALARVTAAELAAQDAQETAVKDSDTLNVALALMSTQCDQAIRDSERAQQQVILAQQQRDAAAQRESAAVQERDNVIRKLEDVIRERDHALHSGYDALQRAEQAEAAAHLANCQQTDAIRRAEAAEADLRQTNQAAANAVHERDMATHERNEAVCQRNQATSERDTATHQRDEATRQCKAAICERDQAARARDEAARAQDEAVRKLDKAIRERDRAISERNQVTCERDMAVRERDEAVRTCNTATRHYDAAGVNPVVLPPTPEATPNDLAEASGLPPEAVPKPFVFHPRIPFVLKYVPFKRRASFPEEVAPRPNRAKKPRILGPNNSLSLSPPPLPARRRSQRIKDHQAAVRRRRRLSRYPLLPSSSGMPALAS